MRREWTSIPVLVALMLIAGAATAAEADHKYVGVKKCATCHKKELIGDQLGEWKKGPHAKAYEVLKGEEAAKFAVERGIAGPANEAEDCLKCHVTAYGMPASAFAKAPLKSSNSVQCESCHGPGKDYRKKKTMSDRDKSIAAGMWEPGKDEKICLGCHNQDSPTFDAAAGFDFDARKEEIQHPIPEEVKGKYLEIVAQRKAERKASGAADDGDEEDE